MPRKIDLMRRALPFSQWPARDREFWEKAIRDGDIFDERGSAAHWSPRTRETNIQHYARWLGYLRWKGELCDRMGPASRVTREKVGAYNQHLTRIVAPRTRLSMLVGLKVTIQAMYPEDSWRWLQDFCNRVQKCAKPIRDKRSRILPSGEIYVRAKQELKRIADEPATLKAAIAFRDALILALMAARPIRVRNATAIEVGKHLIKIECRWRLAFLPDEVKNHEPIEFFLPDDLVKWLELYIENFRPIFPGAALSSRFWLNQYGPVTDDRFIYNRMIPLTRRLFGKPINPHLLRDCAASTLAMQSPEFIRDAARLLGHRHFSTTERYYIQADDLAASRSVNDILEHILASLEPEL
jgi:integrase